MSEAPVPPACPIVLICGEDEFGVKERALQVFREWTQAAGPWADETIDAAVNNSGEALQVVDRLRQALQTLPFFGQSKVVWLRNCNFLGDDRISAARELTDALSQLAGELKVFRWDGQVRLLISAGRVDKRRLLYKTIEKLGAVETVAGWSADDKDWAEQAALWVRRALQQRGKDIQQEALDALIQGVGPSPRLLATEVEKLCTYVGQQPHIALTDVHAVCARNKTARAFALGDALGERRLPELLRRLDEELWGVRLDSDKSEIGLLYGLITKVRAMLLAKALVRAGWVSAGADYSQFTRELRRVPADQLPTERRFNPLAFSPYMLYRALQHARHYTAAELTEAMNVLLDSNRRLVSSGLDEALVLQQALVRIVGTSPQPARRAA